MILLNYLLMKNNLFENLAPHIRRRLKPEHLKHVLNTIIEYDYDFTPCSYDDVGEFVSEICDTLKDVFLDNISMEFPVELTPKDKDDVYYYFVDLFGDYLVKEHEKLCSDKSTNESIINWEAWKKVNGEKNKIIISESQFYRLLEQTSDEISGSDIRLALKKAFPNNWVPRNKEFSAGLRGIYTIGERLGKPEETWSIMNYFDTMLRNRMINKEWKREGNKTNKIDWLVDLFTGNSEFLNTLLDSQFESIKKGDDNEKQAVKNLIDFIDSRGIDYEYEVYPYGHLKDREFATDITITNKSHSKVSDIQIKPLEGMFQQKNGEWKILTYGMKNDYKKIENLNYILYNHENYFVIFKNENYEVSDKGKEVTHKEQPIFEYTNKKSLTEDVKPKKTKQETFQKLIDNNLEYIKNYCNSNQAIYKSSVGIATCDVVDMINSIKITDLQMMSSAGTDMYGNLQNVTPSIHIKLLVNFTSLSFIVDFDEVIYDLKHMLRKATGMLIIFDYDQENTVKDRQW